MIHIYNKLVRDKIPEKILSRGEFADYEVLDDARYREELIKKMHEETAEFEKDNTVEELADMYEVLNALIVQSGHTLFDVISVAEEKRNRNGAFEKRYFLKSHNERGILR